MRRMATEIELKFRILPGRLAAVRRAVATASARVEPLAAVYFDTPGEHLARARVALRLRREGPLWVQTLKAEGASAMQRLEHNVPLESVSGSGATPALHLHRHDGTEAGAALHRVLASAGAVAGGEAGAGVGAGGAALTERYATEIQRTCRVLRSGGARIELALDEGVIRAQGRSLPVCELEFELLDGPPQALLALAARWVDRFGLVLDMRSKSERGHLLAAGRPASPPAVGAAPRLASRAAPAQALAAMLAVALRPALANASVLADADIAESVAGNAEYLHQLRVALRRVRSVLAVFGPLLPPPVVALAPALAALFDALGDQRDRDVLAEQLGPALRAAGAPLVELPPVGPSAGARGLVDLLAASNTQRLWLALLAAGWPPEPAPGAAPGHAATALRPRLGAALTALHRQVRRDAARFGALDEARRHRLRRRIKRLRYATELSAGVWPAKSTAAFLRRLQRAQAALGDDHDALVAMAQYRTLAAQDPRAWFAVGWLTAHRKALAAPCERALVRLSRQPVPWRKA